MRRQKTRDECIAGLRDALDSMEIGILANRTGRVQGWQQVATQLFKLLLDRRSGPLAMVVVPNLGLHPMKTQIPKPVENMDMFFAPGITHMGGGKIWVELFDEGQVKLPLSEWLEQTLFVSNSRAYTIREFISLQRHKEASHFDLVTGREVEETKMLVFSAGGVQQTNVEQYIVALGDYVSKRLRDELAELRPA